MHGAGMRPMPNKSYNIDIKKGRVPMPVPPPKFSASDVDVDCDNLAYDGFFKMRRLVLKHRLFRGGWSDDVVRELFHRGEACAAVLYDPTHDLIGLVEQFRVGALASEFGPWCIEVVAGMIEKGETADNVIYREILEEAAVADASLIPICSYYSTPGGCSEKVHLYCALCDLSEAGGVHGLDSEDEDILLHVLPSEEVFATMYNSRMNNSATLIGLQWLFINRKSLRDSHGS